MLFSFLSDLDDREIDYKLAQIDENIFDEIGLDSEQCKQLIQTLIQQDIVRFNI
ncbi:hypothetical protein SAMN06296056_104249 [Priestia filamentosa]|nr:hypothetical protein SAMN06296056_104249 [Priestia filamentosa]